ncbi:MAG: 30S ribosome-binding factor RbfA [Caldisericia bacterium]|nr:30S ribosome-binding factor RbfA [Caldisericia bacterium]
MKGIRPEKLKKMVKEEISSILREKIQDPRLREKYLTVTDVEFSSDLKHVDVYIYVHNQEEKDSVFSGLKSASKFIQEEIGRELKLRYTPIVHFKEDKTLDKGMRVIELLNKIKDEEDSRDNKES